MGTLLKDRNFLSKGHLVNKNITEILGNNESLISAYNSGKFSYILTMSEDGLKSRSYLGSLCGFKDRVKTNIAWLFDYIMNICAENYNKYPNMDAVCMRISQIDKGVLVEIIFVNAPKVSIFFTEKNNSFKYETSLNFRVGSYDYEDLENLLMRVISDSVNSAIVPLHSVECWVRNPLVKGRQVFSMNGCKVGYAVSEEVGSEYVMAFLVG